jgi:1-acyl-sn-glycerol-3-phosphate acyltransferase
MTAWDDPALYPKETPLGVWGVLRALRRGLPLALLVFGCLGILLIVRMIERPIHGLHRPWTPYITQFVCRNAFRILGIGFSTQGQRMELKGAVVANHGSWLDIFTLNATKRVYFVSKSEVANWPGIGWLARATGTVFINRDPREAKEQKEIFEARLLAGHKLLFFPEGTSTDARRVIPFKSTLFEAFFTEGLRHEMHIQPVSVVYKAPKGADPRFYGWWGDMDFAPHLVKVLGSKRQGSITLIYHDPVRVDDFANRKSLAAYCENTVREGLPFTG